MRVRRYLPHLIVFVTSMGVMIVELLASRVVAKHFGNSLYTWTAVIGIVLGGISLGNYLGGRLADRFLPEKMILVQLVSISALVLLIIPLDALLFSIVDVGLDTVSRRDILRSVIAIIVLFLLPATAMGTVSPVMAKYALTRSSAVGNTVGSIYAVSAIGSIVGTFLAGYVLIPAFGIRTILVLVSSGICLLALLMGPRRMLTGAWLAFLIVGHLALPQRGFSTVYYQRAGNTVLMEMDSEYSHIVVLETADGSERRLLMDGLIHNRYDPSNPDAMLYDYEKLFGSLTREYVDDRLTDTGTGDLTTLTLGGGAVVFPARLARQYPGSVHTAVEIDPAVTRIAEEYFDLPTGESIEVVNADARRYVIAARDARRFDIVYLDAFDSYSIPAHLTTVEFLRQVRQVLKPGGILVANSIDIFDLGRFLGSYLATLGEAFPHTAVYVDTSFGSDRRSTFAVIASDTPFRPETLYDEHGRIVGRRMGASMVEELLRRPTTKVLTDDFAPVENLIAPVFLRNVH